MNSPRAKSSKMVHVRLTPSAYRKVIKYAKQQGSSIMDYVRAALKIQIDVDDLMDDFTHRARTPSLSESKKRILDLLRK